MSSSDYKLISWVNHNYIKEIQCGIQTAHASRMLENIFDHTTEYKDWIDNDIIVVLQGGGHKFLTDLFQVILEVANAYALVYNKPIPYGSFFEPELNFALTSVVAIIPDSARQWARDNAHTLGDQINTGFAGLKYRSDSISAARTAAWETEPSVSFEAYEALLIHFLIWLDSCKTV